MSAVEPHRSNGNAVAPPSSIETIAAQRRETLLALRQRKADEEAGRVQPGTRVPEIQALVEKCFRSFDPSTRQLRRNAAVAAEGIADTVEQGTFLPIRFLSWWSCLWIDGGWSEKMSGVLTLFFLTSG